VQSVRQRVGLLKDYVTMSLEELKAFITAQLCHEEKQLTEADIRGIEELERKYEII
jgi:lipoic acid synthetase/lipoate-protein ligase A